MCTTRKINNELSGAQCEKCAFLALVFVIIEGPFNNQTWPSCFPIILSHINLHVKYVSNPSTTFWVIRTIYSRTPVLRPPLGLAICGRNRGVAVIQALEHVATCVYVAKYTCTCSICMYIGLYLKRDKIQVNFYLNYSLLAYTIAVYWHTHTKQLEFATIICIVLVWI